MLQSITDEGDEWFFPKKAFEWVVLERIWRRSWTKTL
jgi:hypothetical protein